MEADKSADCAGSCESFFRIVLFFFFFSRASKSEYAFKNIRISARSRLSHSEQLSGHVLWWWT
jgi:hypothetical protein